MSTAKFNTWQNTDGTENYKCRAWVNFNGTGTVAIREDGNVSSITDRGTGLYTVNFTNAMPDADYAGAGSATHQTSDAVSRNRMITIIPDTTTRVYCNTFTTNGAADDCAIVCATIFR